MKFTKKEFSYQLEEKKSKFIAYIMPYENFAEVLERLKFEHPKANHFVYAYRYLNEFEQVVENSSDDGEPKGTSGKPSLAVLSGAGIINSAVIIVRYFGGVRLGTGGLVRAYGSSVNEVIKVSEFFEYKKLEDKKITCSYHDLSKVEYILKQENISVYSKDFLDKVALHLKVTQKEFHILEKKLPHHINIL